MAVFFKEFLYQGFISTETFERVIFFCVCAVATIIQTSSFGTGCVLWNWQGGQV